MCSVAEQFRVMGCFLSLPSKAVFPGAVLYAIKDVPYGAFRQGVPTLGVPSVANNVRPYEPLYKGIASPDRRFEDDNVGSACSAPLGGHFCEQNTLNDALTQSYVRMRHDISLSSILKSRVNNPGRAVIVSVFAPS